MDPHRVPQDDSNYSSGNVYALADIIKAQANERFPSLQAPEIAHQIPQELYEKAMKENDRLTDDEPRILLSRGDVIGKAPAHPASLTPGERNFVLGRPPPDQVRAGIERVTDGQLHTVEELLAKARDDVDGLSEAEIHLMGQNYTDDLCYGFFHGQRGPGSAEAGLLVEGVDARLASHRVFLRSVALQKVAQKTLSADARLDQRR